MSSTSKVMIITGGGRGIGAATARLGAAAGYRVAVNYKGNHAAAGELVKDIAAAGGHAVAIAADIAREDEVVRLFEAVDRELGPVTALVNNAGILERQMRLDQMDAARLQRVFAVNVTGAFMCAREAVRRMSTAHGGHGGAIVNVSSVAARTGGAFEYVDYAASKAALDAMSFGLAMEVATEGIRVNSVRPGPVYTDIHASGGEPGRVERLKDKIPMKRGGQPEEIARAILWLLSDEASYTTGSILDAAGGR
ncbi:MAG: SDR family oxidoreductase [Vicinamibacterales bacterium]